MTPQSSFEMDEMEFEKELKGLAKKEFIEFRKKFREYSAIIGNQSRMENADTEEEDKGEITELFSYKDKLRVISKKLHLLKKEHEKRETAVCIQERIKEMLKSPEEILEIEEAEFREAIHNMESNEIKRYVELYKKTYAPVLNERKRIIRQNVQNVPFDKQHRDSLKIIKRWDYIEEDIADREKRTLSNTE